MRLDVVIRSGIVVTEDDARPLDLLVSGGKIAGLLEPGAAVDAIDVIDAGGCYVLPGAIDTHTHIRWPFGNQVGRDDFDSATAAAAASGTTTIIDFIPIARTEEPMAAVERRMAQAEGKAVIDYSFHPIMTSSSPRLIASIGEMIRAGLASFKIYTTYPESRMDDGDVWLVMREIARHGGLAGFHAENHELMERLTALMVAEGRTDLASFPYSRPGLAEAEAIGMVARYAREMGAPIYIFHLSGAVALASLLEGRSLGTTIRAETCTHYLVFDESVFRGPNAWMYIITPPIRDEPSQATIWRAVADGDLSAIASDHCAYTVAHKLPGRDDFTRMPAGAPGIEARVPFVWSEGVGKGRITPSQFVRVMATEPARTLGLYPAKGDLRVGSDADVVILDPTPEWEWPAPHGQTGSDYSPYAGLHGKGAVRLTMMRGHVVARDGRFVGRPGHGRFVARSISEAAWRDRPKTRHDAGTIGR